MTDEELAPLLSYAAAYCNNLWFRLYPKPPLEDLISEANFGLAKAVKSYSPSYKVPFSAYATIRIKWAIGEYLREIYGNRLANDGKKQYRIRLRDYLPMGSGHGLKYKERFETGIDLKNKLNAIPERYHTVVELILAGHSNEEVKRATGRSNKFIRSAVAALKEVARGEHFCVEFRSRSRSKESGRQAGG